MRIQKYLSKHTDYSRRQVEALISKGQIIVNHRQALVGQSVETGDKIVIAGQAIKVNLVQDDQIKAIMINKPLGVICSRTDTKQRVSIYDLLPQDETTKWVMVGRLDVNTSGLILFVSDGDFANQLMHPKNEVIRKYHVRVFGECNTTQIRQLTDGKKIDGQHMRFLTCQPIAHQRDKKNLWYEVEVSTGQYRMIRRMWQSQNMQVSRLVRVGYGSVRLPKSLRIGAVRALSEQAIIELKKDVNHG